MTHADAETAAARSVAYSLIAGVLAYPDSESFRAMTAYLTSGDAGRLVRRAFPALAGRFESIRTDMTRFVDAGADETATIERTYNELYGHAVRGTCPPYELEYGRSDILRQASELADISGFYQAFGMELASPPHERPDHVTVECEFMGVLSAKHAHAIETGNDEARSILQDAQRSFLADHVSQWVPAYALRVQKADPDGFYGGVATFTGEFIRSESACFDVACGPEYLELRPADEQGDTEFQCGVEESCPGSDSAPTTGSPGPFVQLGIDRK